MTSPEIPLVDLGPQHAEIAEEVRRGIDRVLDARNFILGGEVAGFEAAYAKEIGVRHCIGVANGTDALELILRAVGIGPGDEVLVPVNTFVATALAVVRVGAVLVLVDCDARTFLIDVKAAERAVTARTRALMPVHLYGQVAPMEELETLARAAGLLLLEDAAQAQGAKRRGRPAGGFGAAAATSFYPGKNLGAYGDAGAVLTGSDDLAAKVRGLRNYGGERKYHHEFLGFNSRLDTLQAAVLLAKLPRLAAWNRERREAARYYDERLAGVRAVTTPATAEGNEHVFHLYVVRVPRRDDVLAALHAAGIGAGVHYPAPLHLLKAFAHLGLPVGTFPAAEQAAREILSLPLYPGITRAQQDRVVDALVRAVS